MWGPIILSLCSSILLYKFNINIFSNELKLVEIMIGTSGTIFGFLLALLALIIQGSSPKLLELAKNRKTLMNRVIKYNRTVVLLALLCLAFSLIVMIFGDSIKNNIIISSIYAFLSTAIILYTIIFVLIFYEAIKY